MLKKLTYLTIILIGLFAFVSCRNTREQTSTTGAGEVTNSESDSILVFPINVEPPTLNSYLAQTGYEALVTQLVHESLASMQPDGTFYPELAEYLPTKENGGVSDNGLIITWKLKQGVLWSDGTPFTSEDVKFTWESASHPDSGTVWGPGIDLISNIETPDEHTVIITYSDFYPDYLSQFSSTPTGGQGILPKHACGEPNDMSNWECNRQPIGTGPYLLDEWKSGEYLRFTKNPFYREVGKPYIDTVLFLIVPDPSVHYQMLLNGEAGVWWLLDQQYIDEFQEKSSFVLNPGRSFSMRLFFNLNIPNTDEPNNDHPILSDARVRRAISFAIDPNLLNEGVYNNIAQEVRHELSEGMYKCPAPNNITYNPSMASALLDEAGWVDSNNDGIRECNECLNAEPGSELTLNLKTFSEEPSLVLAQQLIVDALGDIGIRVTPITEESSLLDASAIDGTFDMLIWIDGYELSGDPTEFLKVYYHSDAIPMYNIMRFRNSSVDELFSQIQATNNVLEREEHLCAIDNILVNELPVSFLLSIPFPSVFSERISGWKPNPYTIETWDIENWVLRNED